MAIAPQVIHGYGALPVPAPAQRQGEAGLPLGEVTVPLLGYKLPTVALLALALFILFALHLAGWRFVGVVGVNTSVV